MATAHLAHPLHQARSVVSAQGGALNGRYPIPGVPVVGGTTVLVMVLWRWRWFRVATASAMVVAGVCTAGMVASRAEQAVQEERSGLRRAQATGSFKTRLASGSVT